MSSNEETIAAILAGADVKPLDDVGFYAQPDGVEIKSLHDQIDRLKPFPRRARGTTLLDDAASFVAWVNRHAKRGQTEIYMSDSKVVAVVNSHASNAPAEPLPVLKVLNGEATGKAVEGVEVDPQHTPGWGDFRAVYALPYSQEWKAWQAINGLALDQTSFAEHLEQRILDAIAPEVAGDRAQHMATAAGTQLASPSDLLLLSKGLSLRVSSKVTNVVSLSTGEAQLSYGEEHSDAKGAPLKVPGAFAIAIPVFKRGPLWKIPARLMYRWKGGSSVQWFMRLHDCESVVDQARDELAARMREECGLPVFRGTPSQPQ